MRSYRSTLSALALTALLGASGGALAQFRPPPLTEAQRLTYEGDDAQADATKLLKSGDKGGAAEKFKKAVEVYEKALAADPDAVAAAAGLGNAAGILGDYARVVRALAPVVQAHPDDVDVAFHLGVAYYKLKQYDAAIPLLEQVSVAKKPEQLLAPYYLGNYFLGQKRAKHAIQQLNRYLEIRPASLAAKDPEIYQLLGHSYLLLGRQYADYARKSFENAQRGLPESVPIQMGLVAVLEVEGRGKEAVALLDGLISRNPKALDARERLGRLLLAQGDLKRAESVANDLVRQQSTTQSQLLLGDVKLAQKQGAQAESALRRALEITPGHLPAQISLAKALQQQGRGEDGIALLEGAARAGADTVDLWAALGSVNRRAGHIQRAIEMHQRVLKLAPGQAVGHLLLGADHFSTGQWDQAVSDYEEALRLEPKHPDATRWLSLALQHRARIRADANRFDEAVPDLRRALDLYPTALAARSLAAVLLAQRSYKDAASVLNRSATLPGAGWREPYMLGYALLGQGDAAAAVASFERALPMTPEPDEQAEIHAGWALAKGELGDFDAAVQRLSETGASKQAAKVAQENLPLSLLRRALAKVGTGDPAGAAKDVDQAKKLSSARDGDVGALVTFIRALVDLEEGRYGEATQGAKRALSGNPRWAYANARSLVDAYAGYRQGRFAEARKVLAQLGKKGDARQADWASQLGRAINRREGERAYASGSMAASEKALKAALSAEPRNVYVLHNLACLQYRKGKGGQGPAVAAWQKVEGQVAEASYNLGIDAQEKKDFKKAVGYYRRYVGAGSGARVGLAREWKERLQSIYGLSDAVAGGSDEVNP
ncbi:MAG TPA: tetratricopeptide repeat protein [Myxococcaceae bacterium]|nr:tetratricopeptide repeat protein [Myxococcaceae bacterium]